jgi:general secretion pathway protein K
MHPRTTISRPGPVPDGRGAPRESGFALVIVLWIFIVLFALGAEFAQGMRQDANSTLNFADETQSYYLATAAANLTFFRALRARDDATLGLSQAETDSNTEPLIRPDGRWQQQVLWGAPVWVRVTDEGGKLPINRMDENVLTQVMTNLGVPPDPAAEVVDGILDWRDADDEHRLHGAESDYYLSLPKPYTAKNAPLDSLEELLMIKGVTPELYYGDNDAFPIGMVDIFSVFNQRRQLNVRTAPPEVLQVFFALDKDELAQILDTRENAAPALIAVLEAKMPTPFLSFVDGPPSVLNVEVQAQLPSSRVKSHMGAVIDVGESAEGVHVMRWMDRLAAVDVS